MADRRLQVFFTVAKELSFTKASDKLHMTQPAVSFQITQLEEQLDTRLFDRRHNRITLTAAGERLFPYVENILATYAEMERAVRELSGDVSGVFLLGASTTIAEYMLPSLLGEFKRKFPEIIVRLQVSNTEGIVNFVENNDIDLGVVEGPVSNKSLMTQLWKTDQLVAIMPPTHELASQETVSLHDIIRYPFICREEGSGTRSVILRFLAEAGIATDELDIAMELGSPESIKGTVEAGLGISILSLATVARESQLGTLVGKPFAPPLERPFSFVHRDEKFRNPFTAELIHFALNHD